MKQKLNIGICRTSELSLIHNVYEENDVSVNFVRGLIDMFGEHNIIIKSLLNAEEEKIFNNQKLFIKYPFLKNISYLPYEDVELDILFIFSKDKKENVYNMCEETTYEEHIEKKVLSEKNKKTICVYIQYNDVSLDISINNKTIVLFNAPEENELHLINKYYFGKGYETYCLDLNELVFNNRITNKENFYNKVMLYNIEGKLDYSELKNPNSMNEGIYTINEYNDGEDNEFIKNDNTEKHNILIEKLQNCNFVIFDNNRNELFYNAMYYIMTNYTYPVLLNKDIKHYFEIDNAHYYDYTDIDNYYSQKYLKTIRIEFKNYFKSYDLKSKINKILKI